nr:hypothetical protein Iba_chr02aCG3870 [Ipomoea batatas]
MANSFASAEFGGGSIPSSIGRVLFEPSKATPRTIFSSRAGLDGDDCEANEVEGTLSVFSLESSGNNEELSVLGKETFSRFPFLGCGSLESELDTSADFCSEMDAGVSRALESALLSGVERSIPLTSSSRNGNGMDLLTLTQRYSSKCEVFTKQDIRICKFQITRD